MSDFAVHACQGDEITNSERPENGQHDSGRNRLQRVLKREANGQRCAAQQRRQRCRREAELGQCQYDRNGEDQIFQERSGEGKQRIIGPVTHMSLIAHFPH